MANTVLSGAVRVTLVAIMTIEVSDPSPDVMTCALASRQTTG
jgi:hypothetical protein